MKKIIIISLLAVGTNAFSQSNAELKTEIEHIKTEISTLKTEIEAVKMHNAYLKKALDINTPILEQKNNGNEFRITKVTGNKKDKTIAIEVLIEAKDENKRILSGDLYIVDLLGNKYKLNHFKSVGNDPELILNVPMKVKLVFEDIIDEPKILKLFKYTSRDEPLRNLADFSKTVVEFRDLNVTWE